jgi:hypothetical protein
MYADQFENYLNKLKASWRENKLQSLELQRKFLAALRSRHQKWAKDGDNPEITRIHHETADLIQKIIDHYDRMLEISSQDAISHEQKRD